MSQKVEKTISLKTKPKQISLKPNPIRLANPAMKIWRHLMPSSSTRELWIRTTYLRRGNDDKRKKRGIETKTTKNNLRRKAKDTGPPRERE